MTKIQPIPCSKTQYTTRKFIRDMAKGDALLPIIMLEAFVTGGRTYQAYKRGGFVEARERGTEETLGAIFWLGGVTAFNKMGDAIGKKVLGLKDTEFELGKDYLRNPVKNYIKKFPKFNEKSLAIFKLTKVTASILLANTVIGFIVPKINQAITNKYQKNIENIDSSKNTKQAAPTFKGLNVQGISLLANSFENDARYKLLSTDVGIAGGRALNARNKHERREILFRDLSSVYFYMFCRGHLDSFLNLLQSGRSSRIDTLSAKGLDIQLQKALKEAPQLTAEKFEEHVFGNKNAKLPKELTFENGTIKLEKFKEIIKDNKLTELAEKMAKLQPEIDGKAVLSEAQVQDVFKGGLVNDPDFLKNMFEMYTDKKSSNPFKFVADKDLRALKQQMEDYVGDIIKKAKSNGEDITIDVLKKACKKNMISNSMNIGAGFAVSAYFLSTAIPKIQYWMTRKQTGQDKFPGVEKYNK